MTSYFEWQNEQERRTRRYAVSEHVLGVLSAFGYGVSSAPLITGVESNFVSWLALSLSTALTFLALKLRAKGGAVEFELYPQQPSPSAGLRSEESLLPFSDSSVDYEDRSIFESVSLTAKKTPRITPYQPVDFNRVVNKIDFPSIDQFSTEGSGSEGLLGSYDPRLNKPYNPIDVLPKYQRNIVPYVPLPLYPQMAAIPVKKFELVRQPWDEDQYAESAEEAFRRVNARLAQEGRPALQLSDADRAVIDRIRHEREQVSKEPDEYDVFISYAQSDASTVADKLFIYLSELGLRVWFDKHSIRGGLSIALQIERGLTKSRTAVVIVTDAYLERRFWPERERGPILNKAIVLPVLHNVSFDRVRKFSAILADLAGFETSKDALVEIAGKIFLAVALPPSSP